MSLNVGSSKLTDAFKQLRSVWDETRAQWQDEVAQDFEDQFWCPLEMQVQITLRGIERLSQELSQTRQDCS